MERGIIMQILIKFDRPALTAGTWYKAIKVTVQGIACYLITDDHGDGRYIEPWNVENVRA